MPNFPWKASVSIEPRGTYCVNKAIGRASTSKLRHNQYPNPCYDSTTSYSITSRVTPKPTTIYLSSTFHQYTGTTRRQKFQPTGTLSPWPDLSARITRQKSWGQHARREKKKQELLVQRREQEICTRDQQRSQQAPSLLNSFPRQRKSLISPLFGNRASPIRFYLKHGLVNLDQHIQSESLNGSIFVKYA